MLTLSVAVVRLRARLNTAYSGSQAAIAVNMGYNGIRASQAGTLLVAIIAISNNDPSTKRLARS